MEAAEADSKGARAATLVEVAVGAAAEHHVVAAEGRQGSADVAAVVTGAASEAAIGEASVEGEVSRIVEAASAAEAGVVVGAQVVEEVEAVAAVEPVVAASRAARRC